MNSFGLRGQHGGCEGTEESRLAATAWRERGQSMVLVALMLVAFIGFLAMVIDLGNVYAQRRLMQSAADAAALAGVQKLALNQDAAAIDAAVNEYACSFNGAESYGLQILSDGVVVSAATTCKLFFAPVLGIDDITVGAVAEAGYEVAGSPDEAQMMPLAVDSATIGALIAKGCVGDEMTSCQVEIWNDEKTPTDLNKGIIADGQRGWLNLNGGSVDASELKTFIENGYDGVINAPVWINGSPGVDNSALQGFSGRLDQFVYVPVYDNTRLNLDNSLGTGKLDYHIVGFAIFKIKGVKDTANPKGLVGSFQRWVTDEPPCPDCVYFGTAVIGLR